MSGPQDQKERFRPEMLRDIRRVIISVGFSVVVCFPDEIEDKFVCKKNNKSRCVGVFEKKIKGWTFSWVKPSGVRDVFVWRAGDSGGACYHLNQ